MHNYFFPNTAYELMGFYIDSTGLFAVVKQPNILITESTDLNKVKSFLNSNGFKVVKNNDYIN